jgi:exopolysaccharide production protein ExoY
MLKLRTMWEGDPAASPSSRWVEFIDDEEGPGRKQAEDARVPHGFARFCRRHSLDELPQFWHVIRGDMALIGPRPITPQEMRTYYGKAAEEVLSVKPGIAGLWQISGRNRLTYGDRVRMDLEFVRSRSPRMYLRILWAAIAEVWTGADAW